MLLKPKYKKISYPITRPGDQEAIVYREELLSDGSYGLVEDHRVDIPAMIESQREDVSLEQIMKRFAPGEPLIVSPAAFIDAADFPNDPIEFYNAFRRVKDSYDSLSSDKKSQFGNFTEFLSNIGINSQSSEKTVVENPDQTTLEEVSKDV